MTNPKQCFTMNQVMTSPQKKGKGARKVKTPMDIAKMNRKSIVSVFAN